MSEPKWIKALNDFFKLPLNPDGEIADRWWAHLKETYPGLTDEELAAAIEYGSYHAGRFVGKPSLTQVRDWVVEYRFESKRSSANDCVCHHGWITLYHDETRETDFPCTCSRGLENLREYPPERHLRLRHFAEVALKQHKNKDAILAERAELTEALLAEYWKQRKADGGRFMPMQNIVTNIEALQQKTRPKLCPF